MANNNINNINSINNINNVNNINSNNTVKIPIYIYIWDFKNNLRFTKDNNNLYQSYNDLPAIEYLNDSTTKIWMHKGYVHRDNNKPAFIKLINYLGFPEKVEYREYFHMGILQKKTIAYYDSELKIIKEIYI